MHKLTSKNIDQSLWIIPNKKLDLFIVFKVNHGYYFRQLNVINEHDYYHYELHYVRKHIDKLGFVHVGHFNDLDIESFIAEKS